MRDVKIILVAAMATSLAGCVLSGKPKKVASAPVPPQPAVTEPVREPLSIPQPHPNLPPEQKVDPLALKIAPQEPVAPAQSAAPPATPPRNPPKATPNANTAKPPETQVEQTAPPEPTRPQIQEVLPADALKQFHDSAERNKQEANRILGTVDPRHMNARQKNMAANIRHYLSQCVEAENNKDMRAADEFAQKAILLAKDLQSGK